MKFIVYIVLLFFIEQCVWIAGLAEKKEESKNQLPILALALINQPKSEPKGCRTIEFTSGHAVQVFPNANESETVCVNSKSSKTYNVSVIYSNLDSENIQKIEEGVGYGYSVLDTKSNKLSETQRKQVNRRPKFVEDFNRNPPEIILKNNHVQKEIIPPPPNYYSVGNTKYWTTDYDGYYYYSISTTLRKLVTIPNTSKSLHIWVANNMWTTGTTDQMINQTKVDYLANYFATRNPSIYNMVRTIVGDEWGSHSASNLIAGSGSTNNEIHIVLYDIDSDGSWGTLGFFWGANNYTTTSIPYSNQALAFFIDAPTFGEMTGYSWEITDDAPMQIISTLAHEFQHMIHFYQKKVLREATSEIWVNEMAAMSVQDSVAYHLTGTQTGPAFGNDSRLSGYIQFPYCTLTLWENPPSYECEILLYYTTYSFGGYLIRNYGGADLIKNIVQSNKTNTDAIDYALSVVGAGIDYKTAFMRWGASLAMNKSKGALPIGYGYPAKTISNYYGAGTDLKLEEANMYGFIYSPGVFTTPPEFIYPMSNVVHKKYTNKKGNLTFPIKLSPNVKLSIVVSPY